MAIKIAMCPMKKGRGPMRVANTVDLKNKTNELVRWAMAGEPVIITLRGKPAAALTPLTESDLESFVLRYAQAKTTRPRRAEEMIRYTTVGSDLGTIYVAYSEQGVCAVDVGTSGEAFARAVHRSLSDRWNKICTPRRL